MNRLRTSLLLGAALLAAGPATAAPRVMASILPIHSIVAAVMQGLGEPDLILRGQMSEHAVGLTPQQILALGQADAVFMVAPRLEIKLGQVSGTEAVNGKTFTMLAEAPGVSHLALRQGGSWAADGEQGHAEGPYNTHIWLDPQNAKAMAAAVAEKLAGLDPEHALAYRANAARFAGEADHVAAAIATELTPVKNKPFIVFHDAYPYFEKAFGLHAVGSISDASATAPSARRLGEIRARITEAGAVCVFREPQYDSRFADTVSEGTGAHPGVLDPVGATLAPGPGAWRELMLNLASSLTSCLGPG